MRISMLSPAAALLLALAALAGCGQTQQPQKQPVAVLKATPEALVLIQDSQARCARIAKAAAKRMEGADEHDALQDYLATDAKPELAAVHRAQDLVSSLLPKVAEEVSPDAMKAVEALSAAQDYTCRSATSERSAHLYLYHLDEAVRNYEESEAKLLRLVQISASDLEFARYRYRPLVEQARTAATAHSARQPVPSPEDYERERREWEASQELMAKQRDEHEAAIRSWRERDAKEETASLEKTGATPLVATWFNMTAEKRAEAMRSWYGGYSGKVAPVRKALGSYTSLRLQQGADLQPVCRELLDATSALVADRTALEAPDPAAGEALKTAFRELRLCARACTGGLHAEAAYRLSSFEDALGQAARAMSSYSLRP